MIQYRLTTPAATAILSMVIGPFCQPPLGGCNPIPGVTLFFFDLG